MGFFCKKEPVVNPDYSRFNQVVFHKEELSYRASWTTSVSPIWTEIKTSGRTVSLDKKINYECLVKPDGYSIHYYLTPRQENPKYKIVWIDEEELSFPKFKGVI